MTDEADIVQFAREILGLKLDPWQEEILRLAPRGIDIVRRPLALPPKPGD